MAGNLRVIRATGERSQRDQSGFNAGGKGQQIADIVFYQQVCAGRK